MGAMMMAGGVGWGGLSLGDAVSHFKGNKLKTGLVLATIPGSAYLAYQGYKKFRSKK